MDSTSKLVVENIESINYLRQKENAVNSKSLSDTFLPKVETDQVSETDSSLTSSEVTTSITEKIDSVKSCESVLKIFTFEHKGFNKRNEKCLEFWNLIDSHPEIQPVNCLIMDAQKNKRDKECQTEQEESEESLWVRALHLLKEKHLDKAAMATAPNVCKYCQDPKFIDTEASDSDHLSELDDFNPPCLDMFGKPLDKVSTESLAKPEKSKPKSKSVSIEIPKKLTIAQAPPEINSIQESKAEITEEFQDQEYIDLTIIENIPPTPFNTEETFLTSDLSTTDYSTLNQEDKTEPTIYFDDDYDNIDNPFPSDMIFDYFNEPSCECADDSVKYKCLREELNDQLLKSLSETADKLSKIKEDGLKSIDSSWKSKDITESWKKPPINKPKRVSLPEIKGDEVNENVKDESVKDKDKKDEEVGEDKRRVRDSYNFPQRIFSLIGIDPKEYKKGTAQSRKTLLQQALKENYSKLVKKEPEGPTTLPCPCTDTLQEKTQSYCSCKPGTCTVPAELEVDDLNELTKYMPYKSGLECIKMMIEGLKKIRYKNLNMAETSNEIRDLLKTIQNREISERCQCPLHQIDMDSIEKQLKDAKYVKSVLWEKFEEALNEKYGKMIGITNYGKIKDDQTQFEDGDIDENEVNKNKKVSIFCYRCGRNDCTCNIPSAT